MKDIDADYYGYRDEDDCILLPLEQVTSRSRPPTRHVQLIRRVQLTCREQPTR